MQPSSDGVVIRARGLTKRFGTLTAVDNVDLEIRRGEIFGLLGPNGAGKTTTIHMLVTLLKPTSGEASVNGIDVARHPAKVRAQCGVVFQEPTIDTVLTGRENMELHARLYGVPRADRASRIQELLRLVDLEKRAGDIVKKYSGGMKRRLEIARGLLHRPPVLFLDEPTLGLDPQTRSHIWDYIRRMVRDTGTTVVLTTHYMDEADALCDRIGIIDHGKIVALDTPASLKAGLGGDVVRLAVPDDRAEKALAALRGLPFVRNVEARRDEPGPLARIILTVDGAGSRMQELLTAVGRAESVEVRSPTLEDVFLHHTGREMREEGAEEFADVYAKMVHTGRD